MASPSPQRPEFHGGASGSRGARPGRPPAGRRVSFLFGLLVAVILAAIFFYWIAWGSGNRGGYWWHRQSAPATEPAGHALKSSGIAVLDAADKQPFMGKNFQITNVPVQRKMSGHIFWIGLNSQQPMLVVLSSNQIAASLGSLTDGSLVDVTGTVEKAPPTTQAASDWSLAEPERAQLEKEGAYVRATQDELVA